MRKKYSRWGKLSFWPHCSDGGRVGLGLALCLMEADVTVFKARIRTNKARQVKDEFWVYDNRCELPDEMR